MTSQAVSDELFTDALSGVDGTAAAPPPRWRPETFPDALVAPESVLDEPIKMPHVPVPEIPAIPAMPEDWDRDLNLPASQGTSAERAAAAREAAAARRNAAVAQRGGGAPAVAPGSRPTVQAASRPTRAPAIPAMPGRAAPSHPVPIAPAAGYTGTASAPTGVSAQTWAPPVAHHPTAVPPAPARVQRTASGRPVTPVRPTTSKKKSGGAWGAIVFLIIFLVASGLGQRVLDALSDLFNQ